MTAASTKKNVSFLVEAHQAAAAQEHFKMVHNEIAHEKRLSFYEAVDAVKCMADDWTLFHGPRVGENRGARLAISAKLGISRPWTQDEHQTTEMTNSHGQEQLARYLPDLGASRERRFHISLSYSTIGSSPEDALQAFFAAVKRPGAMFAEIHEEGVDGVVEICGDQIIEIARSASGEPVQDEDSGFEPT